jgi:hypothetical protein
MRDSAALFQAGYCCNENFIALSKQEPAWYKITEG